MKIITLFPIHFPRILIIMYLIQMLIFISFQALHLACLLTTISYNLIVVILYGNSCKYILTWQITICPNYIILVAHIFSKLILRLHTPNKVTYRRVPILKNTIDCIHCLTKSLLTHY